MACTKINCSYSYVLQHIVMFVALCFDKCVFCNIFVAFVIRVPLYYTKRFHGFVVISIIF